MKTDRQRLEDFKADKKALKKELSGIKKDASKAKKTVKKKKSLIAKAEREIGHWYYLEQKNSTAEGRRKLKHFCTAISAAEEEIRINQERQECSELRMKQIKNEIQDKKKALKYPELYEVEIID